MGKLARNYVRAVDYASDKVGIVAMDLIAAMIGILLLDAVTRNVINIPLHWCIELAQFTLAAYYFMGGAITLKNNDHVRMDLIYSIALRARQGDRWISITVRLPVVLPGRAC